MAFDAKYDECAGCGAPDVVAIVAALPICRRCCCDAIDAIERRKLNGMRPAKSAAAKLDGREPGC